ncbi:MAG: phosphorylase [Leptolyngbyaceae cyanobacterium]
MAIDFILVPQGAEYQAIQRGLRGWTGPPPTVLALPIGPATVQQQLQFLVQAGQIPDLTGQRVLLLGLGGSLSTTYQVGDVLVLERLVSGTQVYECDRPFSHTLYQHLHAAPVQSSSFQIGMENGVTSDRLLTTAQEKQQTGQAFQASCVEMEGASVLATLQPWGAKVAIIRVISDDCHTTIPDLTAAIAPTGKLQFGRMLWIFLRQPIAAINLIRGSLTGLRRLQQITQQLGQIR